MLRVLALAATAIVLVPNGAHLFELPGKLALGQGAYFTVQTIYAGWALFAVPIFAAIALNAGLAWSFRRDRVGVLLAGASALLVLASLVIFFIWVFPANQETANWTVVPEGWQILRRNWEYGHAANAVITFVAFLLLAAAATRRPAIR